MEWLELKVPPVVVGTVVAVGAWGAGRVGMASWEVLPAVLIVAGVLVAMGILVALAGVASFYRARTTVNPHKPGNASSLVTSGVYRFTRNPMYVGMLLVLIGWAVYQGGLLPLLVTLLFIPYMTRFQIVPEERVMLTMFDTEYERYRQRVRRWV